MDDGNDRLVFEAHWFDDQRSKVRYFTLVYFTRDDSIEIKEISTQKVFLKRHVLSFPLKNMLWIGNKVRILGRLFYVAAYGNESTKMHVCKYSQRTFGMIKPDGIKNMDGIIQAIERSKMRLTKAKMVLFSEEIVRRFYAEHSERSFFEELVKYMTSDRVLVMELMGEDCVNRWRALMGPTDPLIAAEQNKTLLRSKYGTNITINAVHGSDSQISAQRELDLMFPSPEMNGDCHAGNSKIRPSIPVSSSCLIILPHIVRDNLIGDLLVSLMESARKESMDVQVLAMELVQLSDKQCEEFFDVYKGATPEYAAMVTHLSSGPAVVMHVFVPSQGQCTYERIRTIVGPRDPALAILTKPASIRAEFGINKVQNAVHCSDIEENISAELNFFLKQRLLF